MLRLQSLAPASKVVKKKREYNSKVRQLEQQVAHLQQVLRQEDQDKHATHEGLLLLAEAILQHKVVFEILQPLRHRTMQHAGSQSSSTHQPWLSEALWELQHGWSADWLLMLQLAAGSNPMLSCALQVTSEQVRSLAGLDAGSVHHVGGLAVERLLLLTELLSPDRYPSMLLLPRKSKGQKALRGSTGGADTGACGMQAAAGDAAVVDAEWEPDAKTAAAQLLRHLQEYKQVTEDVMKTIAMLNLHDGSAGHGSHALASTGDLNFVTGQRETPPSNHYLQAARRLQLTSRQVQHFRLMHRQFNRMAQQQNQAGQQLVALSNDSFSLLTTTAGRMSQTSSLQQDRSSAGVSGSALQQLRSQEADASGMLASANTRSRSGSGSGSSGVPVLVEQEEAGNGAEVLEELLLKHVDNELDLLTVISRWTTCTLSPWQVGQFMVARWPYYPWMAALVELSAFLAPCDTRPVSIKADVCDAAAQAAALAAELGYMDAHAHMEQRCSMLEAKLEWVLQHAQGQL